MKNKFNIALVFLGGVIIKSIKTKPTIKGTIKSIDKSAIALEKTKSSIVNIKEKSENTYETDSNINDYVIQNLEYSSNRILNKSVLGFNILGKKAVVETKQNLDYAKEKLSKISFKRAEKRKPILKTGIKTSSKILRRDKKIVVENIKATERAKKFVQETTKNTIYGIKKATKVSIASVKAIILGTKALISGLIAGGWVSLIIIVITSVIGLLFSSDFGIFFSSENANENKTMDEVINEIDMELLNKIETIKNDNLHDEYRINYNPSKWEVILAIYAIKVVDNEKLDVVTIDQKKIDLLKDIYWNMNAIDYQIIQENEKNILQIDVAGKTLDTAMSIYNFNSKQKSRIEILLSEKNTDLWATVILGIDKDIFTCPVLSEFYITSLYSSEHQAIDVSSFHGDNIYSIYNGTVIIASGDCIVGDLYCNNTSGNYVVIQHSGINYISSYLHLDKINVKVGDKVNKGDVIGTMGNTGYVIPIPTDINSKLGTHLHFVLYKGNDYSSAVAINPSELFN